MNAPDASEQHRYRSEVRQLLLWRRERGSGWVHQYINGVQKVLPSGKVVHDPKGIRQIRGDAHADRLLADCREQWSRGNDGSPGLWFEQDPVD